MPASRPGLAAARGPLLLALVGPALLSAGCPAKAGPDGGAGCTIAYLGEPTLPARLELYYLGEDLLPHDVSACGPLDIVEPPQGGRVLFVGLRGTNLDPCGLSIYGSLLDPRDDSIIGVEMRTTQLLPIAGRPGWGQTAASGDPTNGFSAVANIPVCPNLGARDVQQQLGLVRIELTDRRGKQARITERVFPRCAQPDAAHRAACECLCQGGYTPAKCLNVTMFPDSPDAGSCSGASADDAGRSDGGG